jgi:hypothetical protein
VTPLRRQGAFYGEKDFPFAKLEDVRGFDPNSGRHWTASSSHAKRTGGGDDADASRSEVPESDTNSEDRPPLKRRRVSSFHSGDKIG